MNTGSPVKQKSGKRKAADAQLEAMLATAPRHIRRTYRTWLGAVVAMDAAPRKQKSRVARIWSRRLGVLPGSLWTKRTEFRKRGGIALLDKRFSSKYWTAQRDGLPPLAVEHLRKLGLDHSLAVPGVIKAFAGQLQRWRKGDKSARIPGYSVPPVGNPPPGWSARNLRRYLTPRPRPTGRIISQIIVQFRADGTATWFQRKGRR